MKKKFIFVLVLMMIVSMVFAGCKKKQPTPEPDPTPKTELVVDFADASKTTLKVGETVQLSHTVTSESTTTATYESKQATIASVSDTGLVTALAKGSATIKVTVTDTEGNKKEKEYTFTVEAKTFTLTFNLDGGTMTGATTMTVEEGTEVTLPTPSKENYDFLGWKKDNGATYVTKVTVTADTTVKACWELHIVYHTVTYNLDGGSLSSTTAQVADGSDYVLKTPTKEGFAFLGYTLTQDSTDYTRKLKNVTADVAVYAHWAEVYAVTYNLDGGTYSGVSQVKKGGSLTLATPVKSDYVFLGWSLTQGGTDYVTEVNDVQAAVTLYANWKTLAEALEAVEEGGTLVLGAGLYTTLTITKPMTLLGNNAYQNPNVGPRAEETIFTGDINIQASNVTVKGVMLTDKGRIMSNGVSIENITVENVYVYGATHNVGNLSNNAPFYFMAGTDTSSIIKNLTIKNNMIENDPSISNDRPMIMYYRDVENLTVTGNVFIGRQSQYNDGMKIDNTNCAFGVKGEVNITDNTFANYQQYVIWFRKYAGGTYNIKNNTFENIGITTASHGMATFVAYAGTAEDEITVNMEYNTMNDSMILLRVDASDTLGSNAHFNVHNNIVNGHKGDFFIKNGNSGAVVDASKNYWDGTSGATAKFTNATYGDAYTDAQDVPKISDADLAANTYTITFDLDGGSWFIEGEATYVYGHLYEFGVAEKEGFTFVHWVDANGQIFECLPETFHENLSLKAVWAKTVLPTEFEVINLPDDGIERFATLQLEWEFIPEDTYNQDLLFESSDESVFTVTEAGVISAINDGTATLTVTVLADETLSKTYEVKVYSPARINIASNGSSALEIGGNVQLEATVEGTAKGNLEFSSSDATVASVDETGKVTALKAGTAVITAGINGTSTKTEITITVKDGATLDEVTKYVMSIMRLQAFTSGAYDYDDYDKQYFYQINRGASWFLFEDLNINNTYKRTFSEDRTFRDGVKYICIHDTGNMAKGATAAANAQYFMTADTSIHFVTGNDGIYAGVDLTQRAGHAGDGTDRYYALEKTNVPVSEGKPVITMINGNFAINGIETDCRPYEDHEGTVKTSTNYKTEQITYSGIRCVAGEDGYYYLGKTYFNTTYQLISNFGGNAASIGIESAVNEGTDYYWTMQRTAKLVASLLDQFDLTIDDVKMHNFFSGKNCAQVMKNNYRYGLDYRQDKWDMKDTLWGEFLELVEIESKMFEYSKNYSFQFESYNTKLLDNSGRVVGHENTQTEVKYKVTITNNTTFAETSFEGAVLIPSIYDLGK